MPVLFSLPWKASVLALESCNCEESQINLEFGVCFRIRVLHFSKNLYYEKTVSVNFYKSGKLLFEKHTRF